MADNKRKYFEEEMIRLMPFLVREVIKRQEEILSKGDISLGHIVILDLLAEKGACTMGEISRAMNITMGAATNIINKMVAMKFLARKHSSRDRRVVEVSLLKKGLYYLHKIREMRITIVRNIYNALDDREKEVYLTLFRKICKGLEGDERE